jgi:hypothetical protein
MRATAFAFFLLSTLSVSAGANPRPLPFTYPNETLPQGDLELELYTDVTPLRVNADPADPSQGRLWEPGYVLQNEIEYGLSDRVELGFYQVWEANPVDGGDNALLFDGLKWRVRTRLAEPGELPIDIGLYVELETMHDELSFEEKLNLQRRFGRAAWMANLWVEQSLVRPFDTRAHGRQWQLIVNPTTGFTFEITPTFHPGIEYWARGQLSPKGETPQDRTNSEIHHFLGPAVHLQFGKLWWSAALYANLSNVSTPAPGDVYGPVWFRSVLGLEL